jgi:hypothetical protein
VERFSVVFESADALDFLRVQNVDVQPLGSLEFAARGGSMAGTSAAELIRERLRFASAGSSVARSILTDVALSPARVSSCANRG